MKNRLIYLAITATISGVLSISIPQLNWIPAVARVAVACGFYLAAAILLTIHLRKSPTVGMRGLRRRQVTTYRALPKNKAAGSPTG